MRKGKAIERLLRGERGGGIPWFAIVEPNGTILATADGPQGNIGCPVQPEEIRHFEAMLASTRRQLGDEDLAAIDRALQAYAVEFRR